MRLLFRTDIVLAVFVLAIAAMLLVPLPTPFIDVLLVLNLAFALFLLLIGLYLPDALALLSFPSLLLLSTLFRLSLNVASSRLILSQGDAGRVIEAFGTFLVGGQIAVGLIIFSIITIVNFIVIARGSARVSEVAARFALDALPGKQSSIDADLRSGAITNTDAQTRREMLRKESQLYGAMDGSMKFVQGDAIAGIVIIFTNIIGGITVGLTQGLSINESVQQYTILTVGDGLVTQIPALLISICAGIVVTRVSSGGNATLGDDVRVQLFQQPRTLLTVGGVILLLAIIPGIPHLPFLLVGFAICALSIQLIRKQREHPVVADGQEPEVALIGALAFHGQPQGISSSHRRVLALPSGDSFREAEQLADHATLTLKLDASVLWPTYQQGSRGYRSRLAAFRDAVVMHQGWTLPEMAIVPDAQREPGSFALELRGQRILHTQIPLDAVFVAANQGQVAALGLGVLSTMPHPVTTSAGCWVRSSPTNLRILEALGVDISSFFDFALLQAAAFLSLHPEETFPLEQIHNSLMELERRSPGLIDAAVDRRFLTTARLTEIVHELIRQRITPVDVRSVLQGVGSYCASYARSELTAADFDISEIVGFLRIHRHGRALSGLVTERGSVRCIEIGSNVLEQLTERGPSDEQRWLGVESSLRSVLSVVLQSGDARCALLCAAEDQFKLTKLLRSKRVSLSVVSHEELAAASVTSEYIGTWGTR